MGSPFWDFSLAVFGANAVEGECLDLQDRFGLDVNLVLLCAFLGAVHSVTLTADDIATVRQEVGKWHEQIVRTLRVARRNLKTIKLQDAEAAKAAVDLRAQVKAAELTSERTEQMLLEKWANARLTAWARSNARDAVGANLQALLAAYGIGPDRLVASQAMQHLIAAALDPVVNK